jgi:HD-GYP domain-containing protein (c-di-GMP phosphodiesterase class II)
MSMGARWVGTGTGAAGSRTRVMRRLRASVQRTPRGGRTDHPNFDGLPTGVMALIRALEAKDPYTSGHSARVAYISHLLARELGLGEDLCRDIAVAGWVHDVGKIGVPEAVLAKPGKLTTSEMRKLSQHPVTGVAIVEPIFGGSSLVLRVVRSHHERYDGLGYPDGLGGHRIPIEARIVAVADALDAMTSRRPYRPPLSLTAAVGELARNVDRQFDGRIVSALVRMLKRGSARLACRKGILPEIAPRSIGVVPDQTRCRNAHVGAVVNGAHPP